MNIVRVGLGAIALSNIGISSVAAAQASAEKPGSAYVQCDGQPNNMTSGESAARLLGAVTLLGLFAPPPESPDASKRLFGVAGVNACSSLIDGDRKEGNPKRRLGLIMARAIHQIEAKQYEPALADVALARREAAAAGLMNDLYFVHSRARSFDIIESAILFRMGKPEEARAIGLRAATGNEYSMFNLIDAPAYGDFLMSPSDDENRINGWKTRLIPFAAAWQADRLLLGSRFAEAAKLRDALVEYDAENTPELNVSSTMANAALAHALAGNFDIAAERTKAARANLDRRKAEGKAENDLTETVELLDLVNVLQTAHSGDEKTARRLFSARSEWPSAPLGAVLEVNRRLRKNGASDELIGGLAKNPDIIWTEHMDSRRAAILTKDSDNKTLFYLVQGEYSAAPFEAVSKTVWRTDKSRIILKSKVDPAKDRMELMFLPMTDPQVAMDAYVLHAALIARSRGHKGFVFTPLFAGKFLGARFRTGNPGEKGLPSELFINAEDAVAKLSPLIPDPATVQARRAARG